MSLLHCPSLIGLALACYFVVRLKNYIYVSGQLENTETRERKREWEQEREGTPKTEVKIFDRAAHNKAIVF